MIVTKQERHSNVIVILGGLTETTLYAKQLCMRSGIRFTSKNNLKYVKDKKLSLTIENQLSDFDLNKERIITVQLINDTGINAENVDTLDEFCELLGLDKDTVIDKPTIIYSEKYDFLREEWKK